MLELTSSSPRSARSRSLPAALALLLASALGPVAACSGEAEPSDGDTQQEARRGAPNLAVTSDATNVSFTVSYPGTPTVLELFLDTDRNGSTAYPVAGLGAELMIENGQLFRYSGTSGAWQWAVVKPVSVSSSVGKSIVTVSRADLGSPSGLTVIAKTSSPGLFSSKQIVDLSTSTSTGGSSGAAGGSGTAGTPGSGGSSTSGTAGSAGSTSGAGGSAGATSSGGTTGGGTAGPTITTFKPSGPITLTSGQTVTGLSISNPNGPCIFGSGVSNVHITNNKIGPCGPDNNGTGVYVQSGSHDIVVEHNAIDDVAGGLFVNSSTNNIVFDHNYVTRIRGPFPRGQMVQIAQSTGSGIRITCNVSNQTSPGFGSGTEDQVNLYKTSGTAASPILVQHNKIRGGGPSMSGGGILAGDESSSYITIDSNILVDPGQYGIGIAGGHDNKIVNNKVFSSSHPWANVGIYVWNQYAPSCYNATVSGNHVKWTNRDGHENDLEINPNCGPVATTTNVGPDAAITAGIWDEAIPECE